MAFRYFDDDNNTAECSKSKIKNGRNPTAELTISCCFIIIISS